MKKLVMTAVAAVIAIGANAAAMDWSVTAPAKEKFMFFNASDRDAIVSLLDAGGDANIYDSIAAYAFADGDGKVQWNATSKAPTKTGGLVGIDKGTDLFGILFHTETAGSIVNDMTYSMTDNFTPMVGSSSAIYDPGAVPPEVSPGKLALTAANYTTSGTVGGSDTPEPTSGLLLLLGVAGLALRRKQV